MPVSPELQQERLAAFARREALRHRPSQRPDPFAVVPQFLMNCPVCDGNTVALVRPGEHVPMCDAWREAGALGLINAEESGPIRLPAYPDPGVGGSS